MPLLTDIHILDERVELCKKLRAARKAKGLTLKQVGDAFGLDQTVISRHENAKTPFAIDMLIKLIRFYEVKDFVI